MMPAYPPVNLTLSNPLLKARLNRVQNGRVVELALPCEFENAARSALCALGPPEYSAALLRLASVVFTAAIRHLGVAGTWWLWIESGSVGKYPDYRIIALRSDERTGEDKDCGVAEASGPLKAR